MLSTNVKTFLYTLINRKSGISKRNHNPSKPQTTNIQNFSPTLQLYSMKNFPNLSKVCHVISHMPINSYLFI